MNVVSKTGDPKFATVYVAKVRDNPKALIEFVDALDPKYPREEKWVIIVSTQIGCPIGCLMCDSGSFFLGDLTKGEIFAQIDCVFSDHQPLVTSHCFSSHPKLKIQFARMGEPALNPCVLGVLEELPRKYPVKGLMPCIATTAPAAVAS
ncbi:MAG: radical SAM protein, partial [Deltaproteobacteria bacterium]|nr:radical SAM protein [Deltaproteobacteria bacterium]